MFKFFLSNRSGTTSIEYGMIALLVAVAAIGGITAVGQSSTVTMETVANQFR
jgi:pilus assembly protein Flp/PilA